MEGNRCPFCGAAVNRAMFNRFGKVPGYQSMCRECGASGPVNVVADDMAHKVTIAMFCHPAHLMQALHTFDPLTHVCVSKEAAEHILTMCQEGIALHDVPTDTYYWQDEDCEPMAELRAALEVGK